MSRRIWHRWALETQEAINRSAKWIFASLILSALCLVNIAAALGILKLISDLLDRL